VLRPVVFAIALYLAPIPAGAADGSGVPGVRLPTNGAPPALLSDPRGPPPGPGSVWIEGYWQWTEGRFTWVAGQWAEPPGPPPYTWAAARWTGDDRGWTFHEPYWEPSTGSPAAIHEPPAVAHRVAAAAPPPLLVEAPGTPPSREAIWIPGFWSWTGVRFAWVAGTWSAPRPGWRWIEGHWRPDQRAWRWEPGRWRRD
jgi:hypothetical protein